MFKNREEIEPVINLMFDKFIEVDKDKICPK
jgi:hypothetical protein